MNHRFVIFFFKKPSFSSSSFFFHQKTHTRGSCTDLCKIRIEEELLLRQRTRPLGSYKQDKKNESSTIIVDQGELIVQVNVASSFK